MMQLPDHLLRTYRRYKEAEENLLNWVCATAPATFINFSNSKQNVNPVKLKGRARTQARREARAVLKAAGENPPSASSTFPQISLFDILPRMKAIADNPAFIEIPTDIITTFKTVLQLRQRCVAWFKSNTSQDDNKTIEANKRHLYPVWVLQQALRLLIGKIASNAKVNGQSPAEENSSENASNNIFDLLNLEDITDNSDEAPSMSPKAKSSFEAPPKTSREDLMQDEFNLAMYCLHADLEELEDYLVLELARYAIDQKNADTLPFLINTAIDQALYMSNDICKLVDDPRAAREKFEEFDHSHNLEKRATSPLKRMQGLIGMEMLWRRAEKDLLSQMAGDNNGRGFHYGRLPFPSQDNDMEYLTITNEEKWKIESSFLHTCWTEDSPKNQAEFRPFCIDSILKCIRELKYCSANWHDGVRPGQIPIGMVFGIRILLLATIIFGERKLPTYNKLLETATRSSLDMQQWKKMETILKNQWSDAAHVSCLKNLSQDMPTHKQVRNKKLQPSFEFDHMLCCLNDVYIRSIASVFSIQVLDRSFIFRSLAHLWNVLTELGYLERAWPDLDTFTEKFGEGFAYQGSRPTLAGGKDVLWSRYWYAFGIKYRNVPKLVKKLALRTPGKHDTIRPNWYFTTQNWPLLHILIDREARGLYSNPVGAVDAGLIAYATVVAPLIGQEKLKPQFGDNDDGTHIENRTDLWKLYDRGPGLAGVDRLLAIKAGLEQELSMNDFPYLKLTQACVELVDSLLDALDNLKGGAMATYRRDNTQCKAKHISFDLLISNDPKKWKKVAKIFEEWLGTYGSVRRSAEVQTRAVPYPLPLRPDVVQLVRDVVARRGLVEGVFTKEQEYGLGVSATYSWEEKLRERARRRP